MLIAGMALIAAAGDVTAADAVGSLALVSFPVVGAVVASRRPENAIGWLFCGVGLVFAAAAAADGWATFALANGHAGGVAAAWLASWLFVPAGFGMPQLLFLLFPTGRPLSPRWRPAVALVAVAIAAQAAGTALDPAELTDAPVEGIANPVGVEGGDALAALGWTLGLLTVVLAAVSLVLRFRRARGIERQQLKWFAYAAVLFALCCAGAGVTFTVMGYLPAAGQVLLLAAFALIPIAAGTAILRHRLYDIDVVINRTLVYGALTATLAAAYLALALLLGLTVGRSDLTVALSTLAVAALFGPARKRIQAAVDRRFYRRRYDAARTLEAFGSRLRNEIDLEALGADLNSVVRETVQPAHVSLWMRSRP
jgi:hypothetical protein